MEAEGEAEAVVSVPETAPVVAEWEEPERPAVSRDRVVMIILFLLSLDPGLHYRGLEQALAATHPRPQA